MKDDTIETKLLITIVEKEKEKKILALYKKNKINYSLSINAFGTASSSLLEYFGLDQIKKNIILSVIPSKIETKIMYELHNKLEIYKPGQGIAFSTKITSASRYFSNQYANVKLVDGGYNMDDNEKYALIILIVSKGFSNTAMDAAKRVGAGGGTLIHGIGLGTKEATQFLGITVEPEKDIVLVISEDSDKRKVMEEITKDVGLTTEGRGICFSIPVDNVVGLREKVNFVN